MTPASPLQLNLELPRDHSVNLIRALTANYKKTLRHSKLLGAASPAPAEFFMDMFSP